MRLVPGRPIPNMGLLLFLLLRPLICHASFSGGALGLDFDQMHDEEHGPNRTEVSREHGPIPLGEVSREHGPIPLGEVSREHGPNPLGEVAREHGPIPLGEVAREHGPIPHGEVARDGVDGDSLRGRGVQDGVDGDSLRGRGVQDGVDKDPLHEKLKPRPLLQVPDGGVNVQPSRVNFPCPEAIDIEPCICTVDADENIDLDCSDVTSEEQLAAIFQKEFPIKTLRYFNMIENSYVKLLDNILNGVTFKKINLYPGPFALTAISDYFFLNCRETLDFIQIFNSNLTSPFFPFATFEAMEKLDYVHIEGDSFTYIPKIIAPTISQLRLHHGLVEVVESGTFPIREGPVLIYLYNNLIHTVEPGSFYFADESSSASNEEVSISFRRNKLQSVRAGTFPIRNGPTTIYIDDNQIEVIEPGTFVLPGDTSQLSLHLYLNNNQLTALSEEVFGDLMPYTTKVELFANPLSCDCSVAWIVTNPELLAKIDAEAACADGTKLLDLDPTYYIDLC